MAAKAKASTAESGDRGASCCRMEALVSVDERGQMVLPKDVRERAGIQPGDKLALVTWQRGDAVDGVFLVKADRLTALVADLLGPLAQALGDV